MNTPNAPNAPKSLTTQPEPEPEMVCNICYLPIVEKAHICNQCNNGIDNDCHKQLLKMWEGSDYGIQPLKCPICRFKGTNNKKIFRTHIFNIKNHFSKCVSIFNNKIYKYDYENFEMFETEYKKSCNIIYNYLEMLKKLESPFDVVIEELKSIIKVKNKLGCSSIGCECDNRYLNEWDKEHWGNECLEIRNEFGFLDRNIPQENRRRLKILKSVRMFLINNNALLFNIDLIYNRVGWYNSYEIKEYLENFEYSRGEDCQGLNREIIIELIEGKILNYHPSIKNKEIILNDLMFLYFYAGNGDNINTKFFNIFINENPFMNIDTFRIIKCKDGEELLEEIREYLRDNSFNFNIFSLECIMASLEEPFRSVIQDNTIMFLLEEEDEEQLEGMVNLNQLAYNALYNFNEDFDEENVLAWNYINMDDEEHEPFKIYLDLTEEQLWDSENLGVRMEYLDDYYIQTQILGTI